MTNVIYFGLPDFCPQTKLLETSGQVLQRIVFPPNKYSRDYSKIKRKGEQELCFISVVCAQQNTFLIDVNYDLWAFGCTQNGQLGRVSPQLDTPVNLSQVFKLSFRQIAAGHGQIVAQTTTKKLYLWGNIDSLNYSQLMKSDRVTFDEYIEKEYRVVVLDLTPHFQTRPQGERKSSVVQAEISGIVCYGEHTYLLTPEKTQKLGRQIIDLPSFVGISCNSHHSIAWDREGRVWSWGDLEDGKLGYMDFNSTYQSTPRMIEQFCPRVIQCACGLNYSIALDVKGEFFVWGKGPFKIDLIKAVEPTRLLGKSSPFTKVAAGLNHFAALDLQGQLYMWGINTKNCMYELDEECKQPTKVNLNGLKVLDVGLGPNYTVLIVPSGTAYKLPQMNVDQFTTNQQRRVIEEAQIIRDYVDRKNKLDQHIQNVGLDIPEETPSRRYANIEKTATLINRMKTQVEQQGRKSVTQTSNFTETSKQSQTRIDTRFHIDEVESKLRLMEEQSNLYLPILQNYKFSTQGQEQNTQLDEIIVSENDILKYQYIQMVKDQDETKVFMSLLEDRPYQHQSPSQLQFHHRSPKVGKFVRVPLITDHFDDFDPTLLTQVKEHVNLQRKERNLKTGQRKKLKDKEFQATQEQNLLNRVQVLSKEQIMEQIQRQAIERELKVKYTQNKKQERHTEKMAQLMQQQYEKSQEYRDKRRLEIIRHQQNMQCLKQILTYLNVETIMQMLQNTSQKGLEIKRMMFNKHMKARIIQNTIRKRNIIKIIKHKLKDRQRKIILSFLFRLRIHLRIKKKFVALRKINLYYLRKQLNIKVRSNLCIVVKATQSIQKLCKWNQKNQDIQLAYLNNVWDQYIMKVFKGTTMDKEREEQKLYCSDEMSEKTLEYCELLNQPLKSQLVMLSDLKMPPRLNFKSHELRQALQKKFKTQQVVIDDEYKQCRFNPTNTILLPYSKFVENIQLPVNFRIRFDYQQLKQMDIWEKLEFEECKLKIEVMKNYRFEQLRSYQLQVRQYNMNLLHCKKQYEQQVCTERMKLMMKLTHDEFKYLKSRDDLEKQQQKQKKDIFRKRRMQSAPNKQNIFPQIREIAEDRDRYPYPQLTYKVVENLYKNQKPKFRLQLTQEQWKGLFAKYHQDYKIRYQQVMVSARQHAAQKAKLLKQQQTVKIKKSPTRHY